MTTLFNFAAETAPSAILASTIALSNNFPPVILPVNIVFETVPVSPVVINVPVMFGIVIILSAVGSTTVRVVSKVSAVEPSKTIVFVHEVTGIKQTVTNSIELIKKN